MAGCTFADEHLRQQWNYSIKLSIPFKGLWDVAWRLQERPLVAIWAMGPPKTIPDKTRSYGGLRGTTVGATVGRD